METKNQPHRIFTDRLITTFIVLGRRKNIQITGLAKEVNVTPCHMSKWIVPMLKSWNCINDRKDGWRRIISLSTSAGKFIKGWKK